MAGTVGYCNLQQSWSDPSLDLPQADNPALYRVRKQHSGMPGWLGTLQCIMFGGQGTHTGLKVKVLGLSVIRVLQSKITWIEVADKACMDWHADKSG